MRGAQLCSNHINPFLPLSDLWGETLNGVKFACLEIRSTRYGQWTCILNGHDAQSRLKTSVTMDCPV